MRFPHQGKYYQAVAIAKEKGLVEDEKSLKWWEAVWEEYERLGGTVWGKEHMIEQLKPKRSKKKKKK